MLRQRGQRHHVIVVVPHVELAKVLSLGPGFTLGLHINLPLPPEAVEIIDEVAPHEALHRLVNVLDRTPCLRTLSRSTSTNTWGTVGVYVGANAGQFGAFFRCLDELLHVAGEISISLPARSCRMNVTPPEVPMPGMAGGEKAKP